MSFNPVDRPGRCRVHLVLMKRRPGVTFLQGPGFKRHTVHFDGDMAAATVQDEGINEFPAGYDDKRLPVRFERLIEDQEDCAYVHV